MNASTLYTLARFEIVAVLIAFGGFADRGAAADAAPPAAPTAPASNNPASAEPSALAEHIDKLVRQLGDKDYFVRERAEAELARLGFDAFEAIDAATTDKDLEIAFRAKYLIRLMQKDWTRPGDSPEVQKCLRGYGNPRREVRLAIMRMLAELPDGEGVSALCRLVRFEKSLLLSREAAVSLLSHRYGVAARRDVAAPGPAVVETVQKALRGSKRPGAVWLLTWSRLAADPAAAMDQWAKLIDDEQNVLRRSPNDTSPEVVGDLIRFHAAWLKKLGKTEAAAAALHRLVESVTEKSETLLELIAWLIDEKAWKSIDELAEKFAKRFSAEPDLLYLLAEAYADQGKVDRAEKTALRALNLFPGRDEKDLFQHLRAAQQLRDRGLIAWSRREFGRVIDHSTADTKELAVMAGTQLAEMLHDQGLDLDAAVALEKIVKAFDAHKLVTAHLQFSGREAKEIRSRAYYFYACHWESARDAAKQRMYLDKALDADPEDVDVLIACYWLAGQPPDYHKKIVASIKKAAASLHEAIAKDKDAEDASAYNQYAWLIGNTEGDLDEALRYSLKSLELQPDEPAYLDTLGHVYFRRGEWANAVKQQARAVDLEPHSNAIRRELIRFRKRLSEETKANRPP